MFWSVEGKECLFFSRQLFSDIFFRDRRNETESTADQKFPQGVGKFREKIKLLSCVLHRMAAVVAQR